MGVRLQRGFEHLHGLGARSVGEFILELARRGDIPDDDVTELLDEYARLTPEPVAAAGAAGFPPLPIYDVKAA